MDPCQGRQSPVRPCRSLLVNLWVVGLAFYGANTALRAFTAASSAITARHATEVGTDPPAINWQERTPLWELEIGRKYRGFVMATRDFGCFVDIGATRPGLVHSTCITGHTVHDVDDHVCVGLEVDVWVQYIQDGKLGLTMVGPLVGGPYGQLALLPFKAYTPEQWLTGVVRMHNPFGLLVAIRSPDDSKEALGIVAPNRIRDGYVERIEDEAEIGQEVQVRLLYIANDGKINLCMKPPVDLLPFRAVAPSEWLSGTVVRTFVYGMHVAVTIPGTSSTFEGFVHRSQLEDGRTGDATGFRNRGDVVNVRVYAVEPEIEILQLSMLRYIPTMKRAPRRPSGGRPKKYKPRR